MYLDVAWRTVGQSVWVSVVGEVDIATAGQLSEALRTALGLGANGVICDLTEVGFLNSSGIAALLLARRRAAACHTWLDVVCPQRPPRKVMALSGLDTLLPIHETVAEAVAAQDRRDTRPGLASPSEPNLPETNEYR